MNLKLSTYCCFILFLFVNTVQAQFVNFEDTWKEFLANNKISDISEMPQPPKNQPIDYVRYCLMYANSHFCAGELPQAEKMMKEVKKIDAKAYEAITGFNEKYDDLDIKIKAYHKVENMWLSFIKFRNTTLEELDKVPEARLVCEKGTLAKYFYMMAYAHYCKGEIAEAKGHFEGRVLKLAERTSLKVEDIKGLSVEVKKMKKIFASLPKLGAAWKTFKSSGESPGFNLDLPLINCYSIPSMQEYVLKGAADVCGSGGEMLEKIKNLQEDNSHPLDPFLTKKIKWLSEEVGKNNGDIANLNKAWKEFLPKDTLTSGIKFGFEYCNKESEVRAYIMEGMLNACTQGAEMLEKAKSIQAAHQLKLSPSTQTKLERLAQKLEEQQDDIDNLNILWKEFVTNKDTILESFVLPSFFCDKIAQVKSWTIKGHMEACEKGQFNLDRIEKLQQQENLEFDEELACRVRRLQIKVWDCRYWELVLQARKETHEEREKFGPVSAMIMQDDLNSDKLKCETLVSYFPLGNIGIKYIISTYLCQDIDLAKMGDPEYYKKIATWVDMEVLQKYCEANMRCKEDFFIYLEGHTDGNAFRGARYKKSLDIPEGTPFIHFVDDEILEKETERELTNTLKSNMELGIARAWTVKNQLDFMEVPISIGAWEHPKSEKGGEYRRVEIELNINNLLLDFYEKRLAELLEASGIGERPEEC